MRVAIVGDSFTDKYRIGNANHISSEAPVLILDVDRVESRGGGVLNVANNLMGLGIVPTVFTITNLEFDYPIISPPKCTPLVKLRLIAENYQLLRVDDPKVYLQKDIDRMRYPDFKDFDIIAFIDYNKGTIKGGKATIVDTKKNDLSVFKGSKFLKINKKEWNRVKNKNVFPKAFITKGPDGIDYYKDGQLLSSARNGVKEVVDVTGAGDTVMATMIYCLTQGINNPMEMMKLANKAAGIVISKFGTENITLKELI